MKPYHINKKQILIMGCLGMFPLFSSAQDILSTSVAVIAAAVAASEGPGAVVQSVRRVRPNPVGVRNPWAAAAVAENTRPF